MICSTDTGNGSVYKTVVWKGCLWLWHLGENGWVGQGPVIGCGGNGLFRCVIFWRLWLVTFTTSWHVFLWQQDTGAQIAVNCVQRAHLVRTVLRDVTARMVPSAPVRTDVAIARQVSLCPSLCAPVRAELMVQFIAGWRETSLYCNTFFVYKFIPFIP
jgi:hypothetical protein